MDNYFTKEDLKQIRQLCEENHYPLSHLYRGPDHDVKTIQAIFKLYTDKHVLKEDNVIAQCEKLYLTLHKHYKSRQVLFMVQQTHSPFKAEGVYAYNTEIKVPWNFGRFLILAMLQSYYQNLLEVIIEQRPTKDLPKEIDATIQKLAYKLSDSLTSNYRQNNPHGIYTEDYAHDVYCYIRQLFKENDILIKLIEGEYQFGIGKTTRVSSILLHPFEYLKWRKLCQQVLVEE